MFGAYLCDEMLMMSMTKDLLFLHYLLCVYVIFVPFCVLFVYVCLFVCVCVCLRAHVCVLHLEGGLGDLSRASDDFLHTSSHGILHLSVVHSRYT